MSNRYLITGHQLNQILKVLRHYGDTIIYDFVDEIKQEQYIGKSNELLFKDITFFSAHLFDREMKPYIQT